MFVSVFLAKLLGIYLILISLIWIFRTRYLMTLSKEVSHSKGLLAVSGEFSIVFGLVITIDHSVWEWSWVGLLTLMGYLLILRGILRLAFPATVQKWFNLLQKDGAWPIFVLLLLIGAYLAYCGFAFHPDM